MKRYRVMGLLLVVAVCSLPISAQVRLTPGVLAGIGIYDQSWSSNGGSTSYGSAVGGVVGGILEFGLSDNVSLRTGLIYSVRGGQNPALPSGLSETDYLGYLTIPCDLKISYAASPGFVPYGLIGFNLGILLGATGAVNNGIASGSIDAGPYYNPLDFGLDIGLGTEFPGGDVIPFVEVSGYIGFVNVVSDQPGYSVTNTGVEIRGGIRFKPDVIARIF